MIKLSHWIDAEWGQRIQVPPEWTVVLVIWLSKLMWALISVHIRDKFGQDRLHLGLFSKWSNIKGSYRHGAGAGKCSAVFPTSSWGKIISTRKKESSKSFPAPLSTLSPVRFFFFFFFGNYLTLWILPTNPLATLKLLILEKTILILVLVL